MANGDSKIHEQLVAKAIGRFHAELGDNDYGLTDVQTPEELLSQAKDRQPSRRNGDKGSASQFRLQSILSHISDFAAIAAISSGSSAQLTGVVWASLKIILSLLSQSADTLEDVLSMLDDISLALPRFRTYEETLTMTPGLESALVDAYTEMLLFCARAIKFLRSSPHRYLIRAGWAQFDGDFKHTLERLRTLSKVVDREAEAVRLRADHKRNAELEEALSTLKVSDSETVNLPCYVVPQISSKEFLGREEVFRFVEESLNTGNGRKTKSVLLYGIGGVGKTRLALEFAIAQRGKYEVVGWIPADDKMKAHQGFHNLALQLGLIADDGDVSQTSTAVTRAGSWLSNTDRKWLLIFDNVEALSVLDSVWPESPSGHVVVTSRDKSIAFGNEMKTHRLEPFGTEIGVSALLKLVGRPNPSDQEKASACEIVNILGGLPLAINHIGGFIAQQNLSLVEFVPFYQKNAAKIDRRKLKHGEDERTLSAVWEVALNQLPEFSVNLLGLLALLDPDGVRESILTDAAELLDQDSLGFLGDDLDFVDAKDPLFRSSMIERDTTNAALSMHRLMQAAVIRRLSEVERTRMVDTAVTLLGHGFPNTWNTVTDHQFTAWSQCEIRVAHVRAIASKIEAYQISVQHPRALAELDFRFAWYLYERELYEHAEELLNKGAKILAENDTIMYASVATLRGLIELDTQRLVAARDSFLAGLRIREKNLDSDDELIASSLNAISLVLTEMNQLEEACQYGNQAIDMRLRLQSKRLGNSYSNMASTLLRMDKPDAAEEMLARCPSLKDFSDSTFLDSGNPRFAGDMVLLSRIRRSQGQTEIALRLASKALTFRQTTHGDRLKTCDSLQLVADLLQDSGDTYAAMFYLKESVAVAEKLPYSRGYIARANYRLSCLSAMVGEERQADSYIQAARMLRDEIPNASEELMKDLSEKERYDRLVPWMLW